MSAVRAIDELRQVLEAKEPSAKQKFAQGMKDLEENLATIIETMGPMLAPPEGASKTMKKKLVQPVMVPIFEAVAMMGNLLKNAGIKTEDVDEEFQDLAEQVLVAPLRPKDAARQKRARATATSTPGADQVPNVPA